MTRNKARLHFALETAWKNPMLHQEFCTLQLCTSGAQVTTTGLRTGTEDTANKRKNPNEDGQNSELKTLKAQKENLSRSLKEAKTQQPRWQPPSAGPANPPPGKGKGKGTIGRKGTAEGGHTDAAKAGALNDLRKKEKYDRFLAGARTLVCVYYQTGLCKNGGACQFAHVCLRCHKAGHTCIDGGCRAQPRQRSSRRERLGGLSRVKPRKDPPRRMTAMIVGSDPFLA